MTDESDESDDPGFWSDEQRARVGEPHRKPTANAAVPTDVAWDEFTPVQPVLDLITALDVPNDMKVIARTFWQHTANLEMRVRQRIGKAKDLTAVRAELREHADLLLELAGEGGKNGKIGQLRKDVDSVLSRAWWLVTVLVTAAGGLAVKLIIVGRAYGELEAQVRANRERVGLLEAVLFHLPAPAPEKAPPAP